MATGSHREINVTPLIDVLLVLLIIFMVVIPVMMRMETVQLPPDLNAPSEVTSLVVKLSADLSATIDDGSPVSHHDLLAQLRPRLRTTQAVFVDFVDGVPWREVVSLVDSIRGLADDVGHESITVAIRVKSGDPAP